MGGKFSHEVLIHRVDPKTKSNIRDYLNSLNLEFEESKDKKNMDTLITIDVSPIVHHKHALHDLVVFLENERVKIEKRATRMARLVGRGKRAYKPDSSSDSQYSCFLPEGTPTFSLSDTSLEVCMKVSREGLGGEVTDDENNEKLEEATTISKSLHMPEEPPLLVDTKVIARPSTGRPAPPLLRTEDSDTPDEEAEVPRRSNSKSPRIKAKNSVRRFLKIFSACTQKASSIDVSEMGTGAGIQVCEAGAETGGGRRITAEQNRLSVELVGSVPAGTVSTESDYSKSDSEMGCEPPSVEKLYLRAVSSKEALNGVRPPIPGGSHSDPMSVGHVKVEHGPEIRSDFLNSECATQCSVDVAPSLFNVSFRTYDVHLGRTVCTTGHQRIGLESSDTELKTELMRQKEELTQLKVLIKTCLEKLSELTEK